MTTKNDQVIDSYNRHWDEWIALRSQTLFEKGPPMVALKSEISRISYDIR
ncbi:hypothetical protein [Planktotalea frisia]|nr:hypothetical protein [Planktotalea frisia]